VSARRKTRRSGRGWTWLGAAALAAPLLLFFACFEPVKVREGSGFGPEARANPYLAAERLLERLGYPAWNERDSLELPSPTDTVILLGPQPLPSNQDLASLLAWVESGGRLVATPAGATGFDAVFGHFGATVTEPEPFDVEALLDAEASREVLEVPTDDGERLRVEVPAGVSLRALGEEEADGAEDEAAGELLWRFPYGEGDVLLLAGDSFLRNDAIGRLDHAGLVASLVAGRLDRIADPDVVSRTVLVIRNTVPSLAHLLARHAWAALVAGGLLLVAWLRLAGSRFGPALPEPAGDRRRLLEHVEAAGAFLWYQGSGDVLLEATRRAVHVRIHRREPAWESLPRQELARRAAEAADLDPLPVERALYGVPCGDAQELVQSIQTLETVRRSL
jgi:hypothetical protein